MATRASVGLTDVLLAVSVAFVSAIVIVMAMIAVIKVLCIAKLIVQELARLQIVALRRAGSICVISVINVIREETLIVVIVIPLSFREGGRGFK